MRHSSGDSLPQLVTPSLAGAAEKSVDSDTLAFLLSQSLAAKEHEEVKRKEEAKDSQGWKQRRKRVKDEFFFGGGFQPVTLYAKRTSKSVSGLVTGQSVTQVRTMTVKIQHKREARQQRHGIRPTVL